MITIDDLVAIPELGMSYLAGAAGGGRPITWAHTCDQAEPWLWVGAGDLMMTTGGGLPADPGVQVEWLERLASTHACGLMVGPERGTPTISEPMRRRADELRFPLIDADFELEFASVAHIVIESALRTERARIVAVRRLYDAWGQALHTRAGLPERLRVLSASLGWRLTVLDLGSGRTLATGADTTRLASAGRPDDPVSVSVPGTCPAELIATPGRRPVDDTLLLHHLAALIGVELEQRANDREERRDMGAELLEELLDGRLPLRAVRSELTRRGLIDPLVLVCFHLTAVGLPERLHHAVTLHERFPLLLRRDERLLAVLPADPELIEQLRADLGTSATAGVSAPLAPALDVAEAARQARLALGHADPDRAAVVGYPELSGLLPRSVAEASELVGRYLEPLLAHDRANGTELVHTLRVFLRRDGAWQSSATELGIHRQTLVYRLRTVHELTGHRPTSTEGTAKFWLALQAGEHTGLLSRSTSEQRNP
jgi:purine catabolism regulator